MCVGSVRESNWKFPFEKYFGRTWVQGSTIVGSIAGSMWIGGVPGCFRRAEEIGVKGWRGWPHQLFNSRIEFISTKMLCQVWFQCEECDMEVAELKTGPKMMELGELTVGSSDKQRIVVNDGWSLILLLPGSIHVCWGSRQHSAETHYPTFLFVVFVKGGS